MRFRLWGCAFGVFRVCSIGPLECESLTLRVESPGERASELMIWDDGLWAEGSTGGFARNIGAFKVREGLGGIIVLFQK